MKVTGLRCEYLVDPVGMDAVQPRLSWILEAPDRGQKQSAYQVLVAGSAETLGQDQGDLWDSGKVVSEQSIQVPYSGKRLVSGLTCWWKVRAWDRQGRSSAWSKSARWIVGLLNEASWEGAQWIGGFGETVLEGRGRGWRSLGAADPNVSKWVQVDLGRRVSVDRVVLYAAYHFDPVMYRNVPLGPLLRWVRVEVAGQADMSDATLLERDPFSGNEAHDSRFLFAGRGVAGRYLRVTAQRLGAFGGEYWLGMKQIEVESGIDNVARGAKVTASDSYEADGWGDVYLTNGMESPHAAAVMLRKQIDLPKQPVRALATVSGLGYAELYFDGEKVGDRVLDPGWTDYTRRVLYTTYDVTDRLQAGPHAVGVVLGSGFYNPAVADIWAIEKAPWVDPSKCRFHLRAVYGDGSTQSFVSDDTWKWSTGTVVWNSIRGGETIDARQRQEGWNAPGFDDLKWQKVRVLKKPLGVMAAQMQPPVRVCGSVEPQCVSEIRAGVYVFDFGRQLTGWARLQAQGPAGCKIVLHFSETISPDGSVNRQHCTAYTFGRYQKCEFILGGTGAIETFEPHFAFFGFRYVQVEGLPGPPVDGALVGRLVHTDMAPQGQFTCSNERLNLLQEVITRSQADSVVHFPRDPAREKLGWTQDIQSCFAMSAYNRDSAAVYGNWYRQALETQQANGHIKPIAPSNGWGQTYGPDNKPGQCSDPWWGGVVGLLNWDYYNIYGDRRLLEEGYLALKRWVRYLSSTAKDDMLDWQLGDWCEVGKVHGSAQRSPLVQTATAGYYMAVNSLARAAKLLGHEEDAVTYDRLARQIKDNFNEEFLDRRSGLYAVDSQTSQALPLDLGMAPRNERPLVLERLLENIEQRNGHLSTGFVGTLPLLRVLTDTGHADVAYRMVTREDWPSWLHMLNQGATAIWEDWNSPQCTWDIVSRNIVALGGPVGWWFYYALAGIQPDPAAPGFKHIMIKPHVVGDLTSVNAWHNSVYGRIASRWRRERQTFCLDVAIPVNSDATVYLPCSRLEDVYESGRHISQASEIAVIGQEEGHAILEVGSGSYHFLSTLSL